MAKVKCPRGADTPESAAHQNKSLNMLDYATPQWMVDKGFSTKLCSLFFAKVDKNGPVPQHVPGLGKCWQWIKGKNSQGYGSCNTRMGPFKAHRISWMVFNGPIAGRLCVLHKCDNPACVNPNHLFLGTHKENTEDSIKKGRRRILQGSMYRNAKTDEATVARILREYRPHSVTRRMLAKRYGLPFWFVKKVVHRTAWKHVHVVNSLTPVGPD